MSETYETDIQFVRRLDWAGLKPVEFDLLKKLALRGAMVPKYSIGDLVTVSPEYQFSGDWKRDTLQVVGVQINREKNRIEYTTADPSHPRDGLTDGWTEADFEPALKTALENTND